MDKSDRQNDFDPFISNDEKGKSNNDENSIIDDENSNRNILYITSGVILAILFIWILVIIFTKNNNIEILDELSKPQNQIKPVSNKFTEL